MAQVDSSISKIPVELWPWPFHSYHSVQLFTQPINQLHAIVMTVRHTQEQKHHQLFAKATGNTFGSLNEILYYIPTN